MVPNLKGLILGVITCGEESKGVQKVINEECSLSHVVYSVIDEITSLVIIAHLIWFRLLEGY